MSSDTFTIGVEAIAGAVVTLRCTTSTAGGLNDFATTRSFALIALEDGLPYQRTSQLQTAIQRTSPDGEWPRFWDEAWMAAHVDALIVKTELLERRNVIGNEQAWWDAVEQREDPPRHEFVLRVTMRDAAYLEGLSVGARWGTTAFDVWGDDPARPKAAQIARVSARASAWVP